MGGAAVAAGRQDGLLAGQAGVAVRSRVAVWAQRRRCACSGRTSSRVILDTSAKPTSASSTSTTPSLSVSNTRKASCREAWVNGGAKRTRRRDWFRTCRGACTDAVKLGIVKAAVAHQKKKNDIAPRRQTTDQGQMPSSTHSNNALATPQGPPQRRTPRRRRRSCQLGSQSGGAWLPRPQESAAETAAEARARPHAPTGSTR